MNFGYASNFICYKSLIVLRYFLLYSNLILHNIPNARTGDCPNITCFRCGEFGHHSKTCKNARRYSRAFICTLCGSSSHDSKHCMQPPEKALSRIEDEFIRCMRCNLLGHALCDGKIRCEGKGTKKKNGKQLIKSTDAIEKKKIM